MHQRIRPAVTPLALVLSCVALMFVAFAAATIACAQQPQRGPIVVNGDVVEYATNNKEVVASGNVSVVYNRTTLRCDKLSVNTESKEARAEGNVRIEEERGVILGREATYNFETKTGTVLDANFKAMPYFGAAERIVKEGNAGYVAYGGYATSCNYDHPHYRVKSKKVTVIPNEKIRMQQASLCVGETPLLFLPSYNHSLHDRFMKVNLSPGVKKDWGPYLLSAWRYELSDSLKGKVHFDYRSKVGPAEGIDVNYRTKEFGTGDIRYYYAYEHDQNQPEGSPSKFQRYLLRMRHTWDIDPQTQFTSELNRVYDAKRAILGPDYNILKDYFPREFERDSQPLTYALLHHSFGYSSIDMIAQKRINRWYSQLEKLPEIKYSLPSIQIGDTPFYFENITSAAYFDNKQDGDVPPPPGTDAVARTRVDSFNKLSLPARVAFVHVTPFVGSRQTYYNADRDGASPSVRTVFSTGVGASTKLFRTWDVEGEFAGMELEGIRHVITPSISYEYNHEPTVSSRDLAHIDGVDLIDTRNAVRVELSNKLQTKRQGLSVNIVNVDVWTDYLFYAYDPATHDKKGGQFSDIFLDATLAPYSWMRFDTEARYVPQGDYFSEISPSLSFTLGRERTIGLGHRYQRKGGKEMSFDADWRLNPKWKLGYYCRYDFAQRPEHPHGLVDQQYTLSRDLHCWEMELTYQIQKNEGQTVFVTFRIKAFPEFAFDFNQNFYPRDSGSSE